MYIVSHSRTVARSFQSDANPPFIRIQTKFSPTRDVLEYTYIVYSRVRVINSLGTADLYPGYEIVPADSLLVTIPLIFFPPRADYSDSPFSFAVHCSGKIYHTEKFRVLMFFWWNRCFVSIFVGGMIVLNSYLSWKIVKAVQ